MVGRSISVNAFDHVPSAAFLSTSIATRSCASFSPPDAVCGVDVSVGVGSDTIAGSDSFVSQTVPEPVTSPIPVGLAGSPTKSTASTASFLNRFHAPVSPSSCALTINVSRENFPAAKSRTVGVRFSFVSSALSLNSMGASGESGSHSEPRPADTFRSTIRSRSFGRDDQVVDEEMLFVRTRSTHRGSHWNAHGSVTRNVASSTCLPFRLAGENSKYSRCTYPGPQ